MSFPMGWVSLLGLIQSSQTPTSETSMAGGGRGYRRSSRVLGLPCDLVLPVRPKGTNRNNHSFGHWSPRASKA